MVEALEARERKLGIEPDANVAALMTGLADSSHPATAVALTLQLLSLTNCADTIVGDGMIRGVSGGEKRRVTTAEILVGPAKVLFLDEITTGAFAAERSSA